MLKKQLEAALVKAAKQKKRESIKTIRLILAGIKDKEISLRSNGDLKPIGDEEIFQLLKNMIKQRNESIDLYKKGKRPDLVKKEYEEIEIIETFLPKQLSDEETREACHKVVKDLYVNNIKDMGKVMNELNSKFAARIDMTRASLFVKAILLNENIK